MSAPTPEDVARAIVNEHLSSAVAMEREIAAALRERDRAARAAAIEEAARVAEVSAGRLKRTASEDTTADDEEAAAYLYGASVAENIAAAIRALGEERAAPREEERAG